MVGEEEKIAVGAQSSSTAHEDGGSALPLRWYVVNTIPGQEAKVGRVMEEGLGDAGLVGVVAEILVPMLSTRIQKKGKMVTADRSMMPGYVFVRMPLTEQTQRYIRSVAGAIGFLGANRKPRPVPDREVAEIKEQMAKSQNAEVGEVSFQPGELVKIESGPFATFSGIIQDVDLPKEQLHVLVSIFGRETPIKLGFSEVEKLTDSD